MPINYGSLPFLEAIQFFRNKLNLPTEHWTDLWNGQHAKGFMIAGAVKSDILNDFREAIDKAIAKGTTLAEFRKDFDQIVKRYGWQYNGGRGWRSRVIYDTNMRQAYNAGRWQQIQAVKAQRPYLLYRHGGSAEPRVLHLSWNNLVLHADHPWWDTHMPQNGWGCSCKVFSMSEKELAKKGLTISHDAPNNGSYEWANPHMGEIHSLPNGIDPGFAYNVGKAAHGNNVSQPILDLHRGGKWKPLGGYTPEYFGRINPVPTDQAKATIGKRAESFDKSELNALLTQALGGVQREIKDPRGDSILVNSAIIDHITESAKRLDGREQFFPFIPEIIQDPYEIWVSFAENELTGKVGLRRRYVKVIKVDKTRMIAFIAEALNGTWVSFDVFRGQRSALKNLRHGYLVWGRDE